MDSTVTNKYLNVAADQLGPNW